MKHSLFTGILLSSLTLALVVGAAGCSDDDSSGTNTSGLDASGTDSASVNDARADQATGDTGISDTGTSDTGISDTGTSDTGPDGSTAERCTAAKEQLLKPIDSVSTGNISVYATSGNAQSIFVDASAGGVAGQDTNPRIYLKLASTKVTVTDRSAYASTGWDLALKRDVIFTNSGDAGQGQGSAVFLENKLFADVTAADLQGKTFAPENFFNDDCTPKLDANNKVRTTFSDWYAYDMSTHTLKPKVGTWLVKTAAGTFFKLQILSYYSSPDGGTGNSGQFTFKVEAL